MQRSKDRILTTHVGSLPRPQDLEDLLYKVEFGEPYDAVAFAALPESPSCSTPFSH